MIIRRAWWESHPVVTGLVDFQQLLSVVRQVQASQLMDPLETNFENWRNFDEFRKKLWELLKNPRLILGFGKSTLKLTSVALRDEIDYYVTTLFDHVQIRI